MGQTCRDDTRTEPCSNDNNLQVVGFQRQQPTSGGTVRHPDLHIVVNTSLQTVFSTVYRTRVSLQQAKLTHYSSKPNRTSDSSRSLQRIRLSGDVHPGPITKYPCPVCARNVTGRGVSYLSNRCSGWVHSKCSCL